MTTRTDRLRGFPPSPTEDASVPSMVENGTDPTLMLSLSCAIAHEMMFVRGKTRSMRLCALRRDRSTQQEY